ncbi:hypothetical protein BIV57_05085 [Mangrovactinospora gilvigrisea]|uniref:N-acetylmuramoyl-L-alanine amidase n=1 Tax=Mangrovactinospora gilvigrisea TaxID=1428644 RepID=A0A1J7CG38_9ACTN|nr:peptidoglycan recognition protein [Mangrovactinospora gilvigrisea]OIV38626.1 hypothetical protein BIV57_05085 [Mangrovactinospora gilvigrisea]
MRALLDPSRRTVLRLGTVTAASAVLSGTVARTATAATPAVPAPPLDDVPGSTRTIPWSAFRSRGLPPATGAFSLLGLTWDDPAAELHAAVTVRVRDAATGRWSDWLPLDTHGREDAPDPDQLTTGARGGTPPLWVGPSDDLRVRLVPRAGTRLPDGLRADLVDPGPDGAAVAAHPLPEPADGPGSRALERPSTRMGGRPAIVTRKGWGADESLREKQFAYTSPVRAIFVHHTATGNGYSCSQAPAVIRGIYRYHVKSNGWRDIGYNFLVDTCGRIYEGRAGGVARPVLGAHTLGFNTGTAGIAAIGSYDSASPPSAMLSAIARLAAWKLGMTHTNPAGTVVLTSGDSGSRYPKGARHTFRTISGHRDAFSTDCPGGRLYADLPRIRSLAAG